MTRTTQFTAGLVTGVSLLGLSATPLVANHFEELTNHHTNWGVSQYNALSLETSGDLTVYNPNHVTQLAGVLLYREADFEYRLLPDDDGQLFLDFIDEGPPEEWRACLVVELSPNASIQLVFDRPGDPPWPNNMYATTIFAPVDPVRAPGTNNKARRLADGLGGVAIGEDDSNARGYHLVHPLLFTLPSNEVVAGQRDAACECICQRVNLLGFEPSRVNSVFAPFGIVCDGASVVTCGD